MDRVCGSNQQKSLNLIVDGRENVRICSTWPPKFPRYPLLKGSELFYSLENKFPFVFWTIRETSFYGFLAMCSCRLVFFRKSEFNYKLVFLQCWLIFETWLL